MKTDEGKFVFDLGFKAAAGGARRRLAAARSLLRDRGRERAHPGSFDRLINVEGGAQERRFAGGRKWPRPAWPARFG